MEALDNLIAELERQVKGRPKKARARTFKQLVELYFASLDLQQDEHVEFFGDVFGLLVDHVDTRDLADLGRRIAPVQRAPAKLIRRLANDDEIAVAGPVIAQSGRLTSDDLVMLAQTQGQAHLLAISGRDRIDPAVTTALVDRADVDVLKRVAKNSGAEFSDDGFARLAQRTLGDDELAEAVACRADIPAGVLRALISQATEGARERILAAASAEMKSEVASAIAGCPAGVRDYAAARRRVAQLHRAGRLTERDVCGLADCGRFEETVAALELLCATPAAVIERLMARIPAEATPIVCRAAGLSWTAARAVLRLSGAPGREANDHVQRKALFNFSKLTKATAEKLLRFWFVRGSNLADHRDRDAAERIRVERRRTEMRRSVELPASILVEGRHLADSMIEDLSMQGAKLRLSTPGKLPDKFVLCLWADRRIYRNCEIRWRTRDHIGVRFSG